MAHDTTCGVGFGSDRCAGVRKKAGLYGPVTIVGPSELKSGRKALEFRSWSWHARERDILA